MGKTKNKSKKGKKTYKYGSDIIAYYAKQKSGATIDWCSAEDVHAAAVEVFGASYYIDFQSL